MSFCNRCDLAYKCETNRMEGVGPSKVKIMLVGDCPSYTDDDVGEPFSGDGGSKLDYLLEKAGIERDDVYITFAVKCKAFKTGDIGKKHIDACKSHIAKEILMVRPKIVVAMGKAPLMQLMGQNTIGDFQGHFEDLEIDYKSKKKERTFKTKVIPTYSPVSALTKWEFDDYIVNDLKKVKKFIETGKEPITPAPKYKLVMSLKDLKEFEEHYSNVKRFNTDYETTGLKFYKHKIINAGYSDDKNFATIVPMLEYEDIHMNHRLWTDDDRKFAKKINKFVKKNKKRIFKALKRVNASKAKKTLHNGKFDQKFGKKNGIPYKNFDFDTIIADALIDENKKHDLNTCMKLRGINYGAYDTLIWPYVNKSHKNRKSYQFIPPEMICEYLAIDVCGDLRLEKKLRKELKKEKMEKLMFERQMPLMHMMCDCEYRGMKFDALELKEIGRLVQAKILDTEKKVRKLTKLKELNLNSGDQLRDYFESKDYPFEEMQIKRGKKGYSTDAKTLKKFARKKKYTKIPNLILLHRSLSTLKKTFLDGKNGETGLLQSVSEKGFIHPSYNIHTPRTGRMSSSEPNCFSMDTEILTPKGWKNYKEINIGDSVFSFDKDKEEIVKTYVEKYFISDNKIHSMVSIKNTHFDILTTSNHRTLFQNRKNNKFEVREAKDFLKDSRILHSGKYLSGKKFDTDVIQLACAIQADAYFTKYNKIDFGFKKIRKVKRLMGILDRLKIPYDYKIHKAGRYRFYINKNDVDCQGLINKNKKFTNKILRMNYNCRKFFLEELRFWDGLSTRKNLAYMSKHKKNIDIIQAVAAITGVRAHVSPYYNKDNKKYLNIYGTKRNYSLTANAEIKEFKEKNRVWCIKVPESYLICRRGNNTFITGNCQNIPKPNPLFPDSNIRQLFKASKKNWVLFSADFAQLELRVGAFLSHDRTMIKEIQQGVDLHTRNAVKFGTTLGFLPADMTEKKFVEIRGFKPSKNWEKKFRGNKNKLKLIEEKILEAAIFEGHRGFAKTLGFGLNYGMDANTLAQQFDMDVEEVQDMIDIYFEKYHELNDWREKICEKSMEEGILVLPETGRKRRFTQASDWFNSEYAQDIRKREFDISAVHRQAMNFPIQGYANEIYVEGKLKLEKELRKLKSRILLSNHDGLLGEGPKSEMKEVKELCHKQMQKILGKGKWKVPLIVDFDLYTCWQGEKLEIDELKVA